MQAQNQQRGSSTKIAKALTRRRFIKGLGITSATYTVLSGLNTPVVYAQPQSNESDTTLATQLSTSEQRKSMKITIFSPSGVVLDDRSLSSAKTQLELLGAEVHVDESADKRFFGFAGTDDDRAKAIMRVIEDDSDIALAARGGYGLNRLLDRINWGAVAHSVSRGKRWCGHSDFTAFGMSLLAHTGAPSWAAPMAVSDFSLIDTKGRRVSKLDPLTTSSFIKTMQGKLRATQFQTEGEFDGLDLQGVLWGGNLSMMASLLGTPHFPGIRQGILFLEDVNERPYRIERNLLQLQQAGVLDEQKAIVLGDFGYWKPSPIDMDYKLSDVLQYIRTMTKTPILTGLQFGHVPTKVTLPVGMNARLIVDRHTAQISW